MQAKRADRPGQTLLELENISKRYGRGKGAPFALNCFGLALHAGESIALVGESGSGKTTAARIAAKLEAPTSGRVLWNGADVTRLHGRGLRAARSHVQYVAQDPDATFDPRWSVGASIAEALTGFGVCGKDRAPGRVGALLEAVELPKRAAQALPRELSGGQLQRASIARALAAQPKVLVLDEVTSALDMTVQSSILSLLERLRGETGTAFLFITHDLAVAQRMGDRIIVMRAGRIEAECPAADLARCESPYVRELVAAVPDLDAPQGA